MIDDRCFRWCQACQVSALLVVGQHQQHSVGLSRTGALFLRVGAIICCICHVALNLQHEILESFQVPWIHLKLMAFEMETDQNKAGLGHRSRWIAGASMTRPQSGHSHDIQNIKILIMACPNVHVVVSVSETS